jgi:hypothetical protein
LPPEELEAQAPTDTTPWYADLLMGPVRGLAGAVEATAETANLLLPENLEFDIPDNFGLGHSETIVGGLAEGMTQFLTVFIPATWGVKAITAGGKLMGASKIGARAGAKASKVANLAKTGAAGVVADFTAFASDEERLSNLIAKIPGIQQPLFEYLAADEDDGELLGRIKNVLEGIGAGIVASALIGGVTKGIKSIRGRNDIVKNMGADNAKLQEALNTHDMEVANDLMSPEQGLLDEVGNGGLGAIGPTLPPVKPLADRSATYRQGLVDEYGSVANAPKGKKAALTRYENAEAKLRKQTGETQPPLRVSDDENVQGLYHDLLDEGVDDTQATTVASALDAARLRGENPMEAIKGNLNLASLSSPATRRFAKILVDSFDFLKTARDSTLPPQVMPLAEQREGFARAAERYLDSPLGEVFMDMKATRLSMEANREKLGGFLVFMDEMLASQNRLWELAHGGNSAAISKELGKEGLTQKQVWLLYKNSLATSSAMMAEFGGMSAAAGRTLKALDRGTRAQNFHVRRAGADQIEDAISSGDISRLDRVGKALNESRKQGGPATHARLLRKYKAREGMIAAGLEYYLNSILSGLKTFVGANTMGNSFTAIYAPFESMMAARINRFGRTLAGKSTEEIEKVVFQSTRELFHNIGNLMQILPFVRGDFKTGLREVYKTEVPRFDAGRAGVSGVEGGTAGAISAQGLGAALGKDWHKDTGMGRMVEALGRFIRIPSRFLQAQDDFFKHLNARGSLKAEVAWQGRTAHKLKGKDLDSFVEAEVDKLVRNGELQTDALLMQKAQKAYTSDMVPDAALRKELINKKFIELKADPQVQNRSGIIDRARQVAEERTFTNPLDKNEGFLSNMGKHITKATRSMPALTLFFPFVRTPLNLLFYGGRRVALPFVNRDVAGVVKYLNHLRLGHDAGVISTARNRVTRELASPDAMVRNDAHGRFLGAAAFTTIGISAAAAGDITGGGPRDPAMRKLMQEAGWKPYSIKIGDTYISYQRLDPFATMIGMWADMYDYGKYAEGAGIDEVESIMAAMFVPMVDNIKSKSYLQGMTDIVGVLQDPAAQFGKTAGRITGSVVPSFVAQFREFTDPHMTEMRSIMDRVVNRVPLLNNNALDLQRNVLGEPISKSNLSPALKRGITPIALFLPLMVNTTSSDLIANELAELEYPFNNPSTKKYGVDLVDHRNEKGQNAYDRWMQVVGEVKISGRTLRSSMSRLIQSRRYQQLPAEGVLAVDEDSPRIQLIQSLLTKYRGAAEEQMLSEFPDLKAQARLQNTIRRSLASGAPQSAIEAILYPKE